MIPAVKNITITRGDSFGFFFRVRDRVLSEDGLSYIPGDYTDLTGYTATAQMKAGPTVGGSVLATFTCTVTSGSDQTTAGSVLAYLSPTITAALTPTSGALPVWDIQLASADGTEVDTYFSGTVTVNADVTN